MFLFLWVTHFLKKKKRKKYQLFVNVLTFIKPCLIDMFFQNRASQYSYGYPETYYKDDAAFESLYSELVIDHMDVWIIFSQFTSVPCFHINSKLLFYLSVELKINVVILDDYASPINYLLNKYNGTNFRTFQEFVMSLCYHNNTSSFLCYYDSLLIFYTSLHIIMWSYYVILQVCLCRCLCICVFVCKETHTIHNCITQWQVHSISHPS